MKSLRSTIIFLILLGFIWHYLWNRDLGTGPEVDPRLESALLDWRMDMQESGLDVNRGYGRLKKIVVNNSNTLAGHSDSWSNTILISNRVLENGPWSTRATLYHELGHYMFDLNHTDEAGIMYYRTHSEEYYKNNWSELRQVYLIACKENEREIIFK